jgi:hypothetical protein
LAREWRQYRYEHDGFAVSFPGQPKVHPSSFALPGGHGVPARIWFLGQGANDFRLTVADFSKTSVKADAAMAMAANALATTGRVSMDIEAHIKRCKGRQLSVTAEDGSHTVAAFFFVNRHFFQIEGIVHPLKGGESSRAMRFQQSLDFIGPACDPHGDFGALFRYLPA